MFDFNIVSIGRTLGMCTLGYFALVIFLRISGNRTLSKMNSFDFVITVAFGSALGSGSLQKSIGIYDLMALFLCLIILQFIVTFISVRSDTFEKLIKATPILLFERGEFLTQAMRKARVTKKEVYAAAREQGHLDLIKIDKVYLESNAEISCTINHQTQEQQQERDEHE